jgi:Ca2+-binding RTX toxin-like protein
MAVFKGTVGNDDFAGTTGADLFKLQLGGDDTAFGDAGNDVFKLRGTFTAADSIDGGTGNDTVVLFGDYSAGLVFDDDMMLGVETLRLGGAFDYNLTLSGASIASGARLTINAMPLRDGHHLVLDGSIFSFSQKLSVFGSAGDDVIESGSWGDIVEGGDGNDIIDSNAGGYSFSAHRADVVTGGAGADIFLSQSASSSTSSHHDFITDLNADEDKFDLPGTVGSIAFTEAAISENDFNADLRGADGALGVDGAVVISVSGGDLAGHIYLVVDAGADPGEYEPGFDYVFDITGYTGTLDTSDFI